VRGWKRLPRRYGHEAEANCEDGGVWTITYPWGSERFEGSPDEVRKHMERVLERHRERRGGLIGLLPTCGRVYGLWQRVGRSGAGFALRPPDHGAFHGVFRHGLFAFATAPDDGVPEDGVHACLPSWS
jgi:hypothetical protein